ncbi:MAG TPA: hypothetical protein VGX23_33415 [Actinocrinis sp.]|nr:hypothetical protein [Actinocrinis sp.]
MSTALTTYDLPLNQVRRAFEDLLADADPIALDGAVLGARLPDRMLGLTQIQCLLRAPRTSARARRALWAGVVTRSQAGHAQWTQAALGLAYPGLTAGFLREGKNAHTDWHELQAEMIAGFLTALAQLDVADRGVSDIAGWLCIRAVDALRAARAAASASGSVASIPPGSSVPLFPESHPDIVLARAVRAGTLTELEADLIGRSYLEREHRDSLARRYKVSVATLYRRRAEAVARLVTAIENGDLTPF